MAKQQKQKFAEPWPLAESRRAIALGEAIKHHSQSGIAEVVVAALAFEKFLKGGYEEGAAE
jgi:hypothetical protein